MDSFREHVVDALGTQSMEMEIAEAQAGSAVEISSSLLGKPDRAFSPTHDSSRTGWRTSRCKGICREACSSCSLEPYIPPPNRIECQLGTPHDLNYHRPQPKLACRALNPVFLTSPVGSIGSNST
jgi:hypothetical protein